MGANDKILLEKLLEQQNADQAPHLSPDDYFEYFAIDQILKDYDLSAEELRSGIVDGGGDGGLDAVFVFVNGHLLTEEDDLSTFRKDVSIELVCIQAKNVSGFSEDALDKMRSSAESLLNLAVPLKSLKKTYNEQVLSAFGRFRGAYEELASRLPSVTIAYYFATKGSDIHDNVKRKVAPLERTVKRLFSDLTFSFTFLNDAELVASARHKPRATRSLPVTQQFLQANDAFICLVSLRDLFEFVTDAGKLARHMFDSNVRDHQGKTEVNTEIQKTLNSKNSLEEFWWLNNGITVLGDSARFDGKGIIVENPQVVNGVQTSTEIYTYFSSINDSAEEKRSILVRVLVPKDSASQDRVIKATNSQNAVAAATLRSTEKIHRDIEQFFRSHDLYYDRRKNFYKNEGRPLAKIVTIPYLAQSIMAIVLQRPDDARARPSSLLKSDDEYPKVFSEQYPLDLYLKCAQLMRTVDQFLSTDKKLQKKDITNLRFYLAMLAAMNICNMPQPNPRKLAEMKLERLTPTLLGMLLTVAEKSYQVFGGTDKAAKGPELAKSLVDMYKRKYVAAKKALILKALSAKSKPK
ncbi:MAG TPA: AIPR family protein [Acidobacteriaceae bacterium]|jgi:hypothetical protein|nr:AIPR family protein [Acidobacteriaceae bacterium]